MAVASVLNTLEIPELYPGALTVGVASNVTNIWSDVEVAVPTSCYGEVWVSSADFEPSGAVVEVA